ncbi:MAG: sensor histidine kinase [Bryobacteraceae bacterium]
MALDCKDEAGPVLVDGTVLFQQSHVRQLASFARLVIPHFSRLQVSLVRHLKGLGWAPEILESGCKAFGQISSGAAAQMISRKASLDAFFEQVAYNSRRLAKLNVPPADVVSALGFYERQVDRVLARHARNAADDVVSARQRLHIGSVLTVNNAYYQVRESETQAFFGLLRAEADATNTEDLLKRFIAILTRTFRADAGRLIPGTDRLKLPPATARSLREPRFILSGSPEESAILDPGIRGAYASYWSIPYFSGKRMAGLLQFGFATRYEWLPRELNLVHAFTERCVRAVERSSLVRELSAREEQVRSLAGHLMQAEEDERRRVSRELHDETGQSLLFLRLQLEMLEKSAPAELRGKVEEARGIVERIIGEVRRIIGALSPSVLEQLGLAAALRQLTARFCEVHPIDVRLRIPRVCDGVPRQQAVAVYRVLQECYQNIAKHSQAARVNVFLRMTDRSLELKVEDDGIGFDVETAVKLPDSFGLKGMRERITLLGGHFQLESGPGAGATALIRIPLSGKHPS